MQAGFKRIWEALGELANNQSIHYRGTSAIDFTTTTLPHHGDYGWQTADSELQINCSGVIKIVGGGTGGLNNVADFAGAGLEDDGTNKLQVGEGPGIDVTATDVGVGLDSVLLSAGDGTPAAEYATLTLACAAAASGGTIWLAPATYAESFTVPAGVTVVGLSRADCVITGAVTVSDGTTLECLSIVRSIDDAGACNGVIEGAGAINATLNDVYIKVENATGEALAVYMANGGRIDATLTELRAPTGSAGYAVDIASGDFVHWSGKAIGTVAKLPYRKA